MSCISEILKRKGDQEYLVVEDMLAIEDGGIYKGYEWLITFVGRGHRCGYVAVPKGHYLHGLDLKGCATDGEETDIDFDVHGGITFSQPGEHVISPILGDFHCDDMWIGFDAAQWMDEHDITLAKKLWPKEFEYYESLERIHSKYPNTHKTLRTKEYMGKECKRLINQIIEREQDGR